ncbi:MAG: outer membrane protein OmpA-like peptidoglycan-associated protein [bacterium]|jgi:outer membrane protein OmpA-like peptidoglycan-associated protein
MSSRQTSNWISLSDMMTGLMLIFLLIAILTISQVVTEQEQRQELLDEFDTSQAEIYQELENTFGKKSEDWGIEVTRDLVVKFNNPDLLFDSDSANLKPEYKAILDEFTPLYVGIINKEKYADKITEIRIEGHTADYTERYPTYMSTVELSQARANSVLSYMRETIVFTNLTAPSQEKLTFWFSANGLGNGRALDDSSEYVHKSENQISPISRRVEFRIVTNSDELIQQIINNELRE